MQPQHFVIDGNQIKSTHATPEEATAAAVLQAKQGRTVTVAAAVSSVAPNKGVTVTHADGTSEVVQ